MHPTTFIKMVWFFFKPVISEKFKSKLIYTSSLDELKQSLGLNTLKVPDTVREWVDPIPSPFRLTYSSNLTLPSPLPSRTGSMRRSTTARDICVAVNLVSRAAARWNTFPRRRSSVYRSSSSSRTVPASIAFHRSCANASITYRFPTVRPSRANDPFYVI